MLKKVEKDWGGRDAVVYGRAWRKFGTDINDRRPTHLNRRQLVCVLPFYSPRGSSRACLLRTSGLAREKRGNDYNQNNGLCPDARAVPGPGFAPLDAIGLLPVASVVVRVAEQSWYGRP